MTEHITIQNEQLTATIAAKGAELTSLIPEGGDDVMWSGDPAFWPWHAPNLFPIVGALAENTLVHAGKRYPIRQHGFLRHSICDLVEHAPDACAFRLTDTDETRAQYPFAFELTIRWRLDGDRLECGFDLRNPAPTPLYASIGAHPAFRWPLGDAPRDAHVVQFERAEVAPIRYLVGGLMAADTRPNPVEGKILRLTDALFDRDALIFDRHLSRSITFGAPDGPGVELDFLDFPQFGIWSKPGATPFLCLEPWQGFASPADFVGEFSEKPGVVAIAPGASRLWRYGICPLAATPVLAL